MLSLAGVAVVVACSSKGASVAPPQWSCAMVDVPNGQRLECSATVPHPPCRGRPAVHIECIRKKRRPFRARWPAPGGLRRTEGRAVRSGSGNAGGGGARWATGNGTHGGKDGRRGRRKTMTAGGHRKAVEAGEGRDEETNERLTQPANGNSCSAAGQQTRTARWSPIASSRRRHGRHGRTGMLGSTGGMSNGDAGSGGPVDMRGQHLPLHPPTHLPPNPCRDVDLGHVAPNRPPTCGHRGLTHAPVP